MKSKSKPRKISKELTRLAELGRLGASVAHEINTPLMAAQGMAENIELLLDRDPLPREEIRLQILEVIKSCHRISRTVKKMKRLSGEQKVRLFVVDLAEVALSVVDFLASQISQLDVTLEFDFSDPLPVKCDSVQVEQIILNILTEGLTALEQRSADRKIRVSFSELGDKQLCKIWHNAQVIPNADSESMMVSKAVMQAHEGNLVILHAGDAGTEYCLAFPRPAQNPWQQRARQNHGPVIIIDRQASFRRTIEQKFNLLGFTVKTAATHGEGLNAIKNNEVAGVIVDVIPGQRESGKIVRQLRTALGPDALIFTMSNFPSARDTRSEFKDFGATECFEKPIHAEGFALILKLLDTAALAASGKQAA